MYGGVSGRYLFTHNFKICTNLNRSECLHCKNHLNPDPTTQQSSITQLSAVKPCQFSRYHSGRKNDHINKLSIVLWTLWSYLFPSYLDLGHQTPHSWYQYLHIHWHRIVGDSLHISLQRILKNKNKSKKQSFFTRINTRTTLFWGGHSL